MKLKDGMMITEIGGERVLVDAGVSGECFRGIIRLNDTGAFISELLMKETTEDEIVEALMREYEGATEDDMKEHVCDFIAKLDAEKLIEK